MERHFTRGKHTYRHMGFSCGKLTHVFFAHYMSHVIHIRHNVETSDTLILTCGLSHMKTASHVNEFTYTCVFFGNLTCNGNYVIFRCLIVTISTWYRHKWFSDITDVKCNSIFKMQLLKKESASVMAVNHQSLLLNELSVSAAQIRVETKTQIKWLRDLLSISFTCTWCLYNPLHTSLQTDHVSSDGEERCDNFFLSQQSNHQQGQAFCARTFHFSQFHDSFRSRLLLYGVRCSVRVGGHLFPAWSPFAQSAGFVLTVMNSINSGCRGGFDLGDYRMNECFISSFSFLWKTNTWGHFCLLLMFFKIPPNC